MAIALDLDGVVWLSDQPIPGAAAAVARLRERGEQVAFVTNNAKPRRSELEDQLRRHGIDPADDVVSSPMAAAALVQPGERALLCAGEGVEEALARRGVEVVRDGDADVVVVGLHFDFDYQRMKEAATAVRRGARLLATNDDATFPTPDGPVPGGGAILASIVTASGVPPVIAGKPHQPMADLVRARLGDHGWVIGDRPDTDGGFARTLGYRFALVMTGVTRPEDLPVDPEPDLIADDLGGVIAQLDRTPRP